MARPFGALALALTTAAFVALLLLYYPGLPDPVASHFDGAGNADGTMRRPVFLVVSLCLALGDGALFAGLVWLIGRLPASTLNLPNREYWLAPERRQATVRHMAAGLLWLGAVTQLFLLANFWLLLEANVRVERRLPDGVFWPLLLGYLGYVALWIVVLFRRYRLPAAARG